jgi:hypothetical protein
MLSHLGLRLTSETEGVGFEPTVGFLTLDDHGFVMFRRAAGGLTLCFRKGAMILYANRDHPELSRSPVEPLAQSRFSVYARNKCFTAKRHGKHCNFQGADGMATERPQRQNIKAIESHAGSTQAMPDNRVLLTLDDGRSLVIDAERLDPQADGTYVVEIVAADHR